MARHCRKVLLPGSDSRPVPPPASPLPPDNEPEVTDSKPLHLTATCTVQPSSSQGVNAIALQNPLGTPMEIHEIKWTGYCGRFGASTTAAKVGAGFTKMNGATLKCRLDLGTIEITNGFVPISIFGKGGHDSAETFLQRTGNAAPADGFNRMEYRWKLSRPLYVPAGGLLIPQFQHTGQIPVSIDVRICYEARSLPAGYKPAKAYIPWVASYSSPPTDISTVNGTSAITFNSNEPDLINKFDTPLIVNRLAGRFSLYDNSAIGVYESAYYGASALSMRLVDSNGNALVRVMSPFSQIFHNTTKSWEMRGVVLPPKSYYQAYFSLAPSAGVTASRYFGQALVGLVGTREVAR